MANKERPLPKPQNKAFGRKNNFEQSEEEGSLLADRMAIAAAEGKLDEFLKQEMPDNEYARNLASMMMGMTGMVPQPGEVNRSEKPKPGAEEAEAAPKPEAADVPDDIRQAIMGGDIQSLMGLLRREHQKRNPDSPLLRSEEKEQASPSEQEPTPAAQMPGIDKELIDALLRIAADNSVTLDWIILRAIKVYVQEYQKTGKL